MRTKRRSKRRKIKNEPRLTWGTRTCIINEDLLLHDLLIEILRRLPSKFIARSLLVSKLWSTIIRSQDFISSFPYRSPSPRLLFAFNNLYDQNKIWNFFSFSFSTSTKEPLSYLSRTTCSKPNIPKAPIRRHSYVNEDPHYVDGLISLGSGREQIICNPSTGKSITLPKVNSRKLIIQSFFGYDPVDGQYKVLCMSETLFGYSHVRSFEHQVFTLGVDKSWRMIECNILHCPKTKGVCINGVVYYGAFTGIDEEEEWCLARFDVRSETFDQVVQFLGDSSPSLSNYCDPSLISYKGKVTLAIEVKQQKFELWVLEDAEKHEWSKVCFFLHLSWEYLRISGDITHTDEIVFVSHDGEDFYIVYYNHKNKSLRADKIRGNSNKELGEFWDMVPFFNYVESVMLL